MEFKALPDDTEPGAWKAQMAALRRMGMEGRARIDIQP